MASISPPSPGPAPRLRSPAPPAAPPESTLSRFFIAPLTFLSFILSLALIDSRNFNNRVHSQSCTRSPPSTLAGRSRGWLRGVVFAQTDGNPSPYASVSKVDLTSEGKGGGGGSGSAGDSEPTTARSGCWCEAGSGISKSEAGDGKGKGGGNEKWHWHTMQRKQMRSQVDDAFRLRKWVVLALVVGLSAVFLGFGMALRWFWMWF